MVNGFVVYEGPSAINGAPIVAISTGFMEPSMNPKTGPMIQVWIISAEDTPHSAAVNGTDASVCGDCPLRTQINPITGTQERKCYVTPFQAPLSVYKAWKAGNYPRLDSDDLTAMHAGFDVRLGAYGDPAALPFDIAHAIIADSASHTGYTHQWRTCDPNFRSVVMASVDSADDYAHAKAAEWRTFRTLAHGEALESREISCPASDEAGKRTRCIDCGLCNGARDYARGADPRRDIAIQAHGNGTRLFVAVEGLAEGKALRMLRAA